MLNNSLRLFKAIFEFNFDISYFSMLQRVQPCFELNLFFVRAKISQLILKSSFFSFKSQTYFESVVLSLYLLLLKEHLCLVYLLLNDKPDDPNLYILI